jgi:hypothetical protein
MKLLSAEAVAMADSLEVCGASVTHVTSYITKLRGLAKVYDKTHRLLKAPRYPSYKPFGPSHNSLLEACPTNLHTSQIDVLSPSSTPPPSPSSPYSEDDSVSPVVSVDTTSYLISTMACPSLTHSFSKKDRETLGHASTRRGLIQELRTHAVGLMEVQGVLHRFLDGLRASPEPSGPSFSDTSLLAVPRAPTTDLTPSSSPSSSPTASPSFPHRTRFTSISTPTTAIRLELDGLTKKVDDLVALLESKLLVSVVEEVEAPCWALGKDPTATLREFSAKLRTCKDKVLIAAVTPGPHLSSAIQTLVETVTKYTHDVELFLSLSLAECDDPSLLQTYDMLFSQCVAALATAFSRQLLVAVRGQLNPEPEYGQSGEAVSCGWLQLLACKGALFHLESIMSDDKEMKLLQDLDFVAKQLKSVLLHVVAMESTLDVKSEYPEVTLSGSRSALHLTFALPPHLYKTLPSTLQSSRGIKVQPMLFNKGLFDNFATDAYKLEKTINTASLQVMKEYYRQLRTFRLGGSLHRQTSEEKTKAIEEVSRPLRALDLLARQVGVAIREPTRPGVGLLTVAAELATRMGALRVCVCDSGVFRCGTACSLEQVMILVRSHQLPLKSLRLALDTMRKKGSFITILRKNNADIQTSLPQQPPK